MVKLPAADVARIALQDDQGEMPEVDLVAIYVTPSSTGGALFEVEARFYRDAPANQWLGDAFRGQTTLTLSLFDSEGRQVTRRNGMLMRLTREYLPKSINANFEVWCPPTRKA